MAGARPRQGRGASERAIVPAPWEGCKRNELEGSFAELSEPSMRAQAEMCPISPQRGGGGLFEAELAARMSEGRQMCPTARGAQCPTRCRLYGEAAGAPALPPLGDRQPLRSAAPGLLPSRSRSLIFPGIVSTMPKPSEARRGFFSSLLGWIIMGEAYYVAGIAHSHPKPSEARRGFLTSPCTSGCMA